jgi:hypothetical protein
LKPIIETYAVGEISTMRRTLQDGARVARAHIEKGSSAHSNF